MEQPEKQLRKIKFSNELDMTEIMFVLLNAGASEKEEEEENDDAQAEQVMPHSYTVKSPNEPHKDFVDAMKKLRKFALEVCEIEVDSKDIACWNVSEVQIAGDYLLKQSRVVMTLSKVVKASGKVIKFKTPQVTMYPQKDDQVKYHNASKMTEAIEQVIKEAWLYLAGKYSQKGQLALFELSHLKVA